MAVAEKAIRHFKGLKVDLTPDELNLLFNLDSELGKIMAPYSHDYPDYIEILYRYTINRSNRSGEEYTSWLGSYATYFGGHSRTTKVNAANKLIEYLKGNYVVFTREEYKALKQGVLGKLVRRMNIELSKSVEVPKSTLGEISIASQV